MKFSVTTENLAGGLQIVSRLATTRATLPILGNIYIEADGGRLKLAATDLDLGIESYINAKVEESGSITLPARTLVDFVTNNHDTSIRFTIDDVTCRVESAHARAEIKGMDATEFPTIPSVDNGVEVVAPAPLVREAISKTAFATIQDETRPVLAGVALYGDKGTLTFVATDSYRLAEYQIAVTTPLSEVLRVIVPAKSLQEVARLITDDKANVTLVFGEHQVSARVGETVLVSRLIDGAFPDYKAILPRDFSVTVAVSRHDLINHLKMVSLFSRDSAYNVTFTTKPKELELRAVSGVIGSGTAMVEAATSGPEMAIAFNARFVLDGLQVIEGESVHLKLIPNEGNRWFPGLLESTNEDNYHYVVMPLRTEGA